MAEKCLKVYNIIDLDLLVFSSCLHKFILNVN